MWRWALIACVFVVGCRSTGPFDPPPDPTDTTILRHDGTPLTLESIRANRRAAVLAADTVYRIEHELAEPWQETRTAAQLVGAVASRWPSDTQLADAAWRNAEACGPRGSRASFHEYGFYAIPETPFDVILKADPANLEQYCNKILAGHSGDDDAGFLLAAWRRFSPPTLSRGEKCLAARWLIELEHLAPVRVEISESLLGPHSRCRIADHGNASFRGPMTTHEGYMCSAVLADLLAAGSGSPVQAAIDALRTRVVDGRPLPPDLLCDGPADQEQDIAFLRAMLLGLASGSAELAWLPRGARRVSALFSYLVNAAEARVSMSLLHTESGWTLDVFDYEPASASLTGNSGARLDLMPMLRALRAPSGS